MQVFGIGIDVVEIDRIEESIEKFGDKFLDRIFTPTERAYCDAQKRPHVNYAARFAVKEAVSKAFGTGIGKELSWLDMTILRAASGEPRVELSGAGKDFAESHKIVQIKISLTHAKLYAAANAIALSES
ncbi:holo-ACP synthase [Rubritalea tangerina]|uniref:Holo-[acyl-carrier-protein] synthase n=1 Tax=Rubritalea tangerina TaxID=430798 RepID=A0ABW4ZGJ6_9BACT